MEFWGRDRELGRLRAELDRVRTDGIGRLLAIRGRRQVGKSRMLTELIERSGVPYLYLYTTAATHAFPWAVESDNSLDGVLQAAWDRSLERVPVMFVLVGSDLTMMERLTQYDHPLYGRAQELVVGALTPADVSRAVGGDRGPIDVLDLYLATGGYPRLLAEAGRHATTADYVIAQLAHDQSLRAWVGTAT